MSNKMTLGQRVKAFFGGINFIPSMSFTDEIISEATYSDKASQIKANLGWVFAANDLISETCASVRLKLVRVDKDGNDEEIYKHELLDLLNNPNAILTAKQFWALYFSYLNLTGEAYILKLDSNGKPLYDRKKLPTALYPMPSHLCFFKVGDKSYADSTVTYGGETYPISAILRDINPNPENFFTGMSVVQKAALTVDTDYQMKRWNNQMFKNNARPGSVISFPGALSDENFKRAKQMYAEQTAGTSNAFKNLILDNGATVTPYMMSNQDLDFLASKAFTRDEILAMFKVSTSNLGIVEDVNRANADAQEYGFMKRCVKPRLEQLKDFLNARLVKPIYGSEYEIDFDDVIPEDTEEKLQEAVAGVNKWLTIDEVRERYDLEPLPNGLGKEIYSQINLVPLSELSAINNADISNAEGSNDDGTDENEEEPENEPKSPSDAQETPNNDEKAMERARIGNAKAVKYNALRVKYVRQITKASRVMFDSQKADAEKWIDEHAKDFGNFVFKKGWAEDMVNWSEYKSQFAQTILAILQEIVKTVGEEAYNQIVEDGEFNPATKEIEKYLREQANLNSIEVNDETEKQIKATLKEGINAKESVEQLKARVLAVFGTASTQRAYRIALTESATAQNYADVAAWKQTGVVVAKEWFTAEDEHVCGFCDSMDGKIIGLDEDFFEKGDYVSYTSENGKDHVMKLDYRDIGEPPLHPDCRCVLLPVMQ